MGVTAFSAAAADYLVSLCAQLAMLLSYQWLCHCCFRLVRHNLELILVVWLFQAFLQQRHSALAARKPVSTAAPRRQASQQALHYRQMMHTTRCCVLFSKKKKRVLHSSVPLFYKAPTPEACKDKGPDMAPPKRVVLRYLNAAINNYEY